MNRQGLIDKLHFDKIMVNCQDDVDSAFMRCLSEIEKLAPKRIDFRLTPNKSLSFRVRLYDDRQVLIKVFYKDIDRSDCISCVYSVWTAGKREKHSHGVFSSCFRKLVSHTAQC